jgi:aerobic-type carbon monoxide dehydrogenase small subunit (CoxS/CutS family)
MARITVKGIPHDVEVGPEAPLLSVLREQLGLTGANAVARKADVAQPGFRQAEGRLPGMLHG